MIDPYSIGDFVRGLQPYQERVNGDLLVTLLVQNPYTLGNTKHLRKQLIRHPYVLFECVLCTLFTMLLAQKPTNSSPWICLMLIQSSIDLSYLEPRCCLLLTSIGFRQFRKSFYAISTIIEHLCPFQTFTISSKVCKVYTRRWWLNDPAATKPTVTNSIKTVYEFFGLQETGTSSPL